MIDYRYPQSEISSEPDSNRRILSFDMNEVQFNDFHLMARRLPEHTQPEFRIDGPHVVVNFDERITLRFENAAAHLPANLAFMLMGRVSYVSHIEVVIAIVIMPA